MFQNMYPGQHGNAQSVGIDGALYPNNPSELPVLSAKEQTMMWHQNSYFCDSGIQSAAVSAVASVSGRTSDPDDDIENGRLDTGVDLYDLDQGSFGHNYNVIDQPNVQHQSNDVLLDNPHQEMHQQSMVIQDGQNSFNQLQSIGDQSHMQLQQLQPIVPEHQLQHTVSSEDEELKNAVNNLMHCQDDADMVTRIIPQLIEWLNESDEVIVSRAAILAHQMSKREASRHAIMNCPAMVEALVRAIAVSNELETTKAAIGTLHNLSHHRQGLLVIFQSDGIPALVRLLCSPMESVLFYAITTLHNLLLHQDGSKDDVRRAGGLQKMVTLLQRNNVKFLAIVTDCLQILALGNQQSKICILESGGPAELVRIMRTFDYEKLLWTTSRVLKVLSACSGNKPAIVSAGGVQALALHLANGSQRLVENCLWSLRNLSDAATKLYGLDHLLHGLVRLLASPDSNFVTYAAGILSNLTCNNQRNKVLVCEFGGVGALLHTIMQAGDREDITEPAICALRHLTSRHPESDSAQNQVRLLPFGMQSVIRLLGGNSRWPLVKAVIGLIRNLGLCHGNLNALRENGAVYELIMLLIKSFHDLSKPHVKGSKDFSSFYGNEVRNEEIIENTVAALQVLAKDTMNRVLMRQQNVVQIAVQLLFSEQEGIRRVSSGVLSELCDDVQCVQIMKMEGAAEPLLQLRNSSHEVMSSYAANILAAMGYDKYNTLPDGLRSQEQLQAVNQTQTQQNMQQLNQQPFQSLWSSDLGMGPDLQDMLGADSAYESMYGQGPLSVSNVHCVSRNLPGNFESHHLPIDSMQGLDLDGMDMDVSELGAGELLEAMPSPPHNSQVQSWYDTDL